MTLLQNPNSTAVLAAERQNQQKKMWFFPASYNIFCKEESKWVTAKSLASRTTDSFSLWNGHIFIPVKIYFAQHCPKFIYKADDVTFLGLNDNSKVKFHFQIRIPSIKNEKMYCCTKRKHLLLALMDFSTECFIKKSKVFCKVARTRMAKISQRLPEEASVFDLNKKFSMVQFPYSVVTGNEECEDKKSHCLEYAKTVIDLAGKYFPKSKYGPSHIRLSDNTLRREPKAFRKMRRVLCYISQSEKTYYLFKVFLCKNGTQKPKRQVKITQREVCHFKPKLFNAKLVSNGELLREREDWISISVAPEQFGDMVVEGICFKVE